MPDRVYINGKIYSLDDKNNIYEAGDHGGEIAAQGTPEEIVKSKVSYTGKFLRKYLK